ncbi:MAG: 2,3-butanediol dehydrogenase [Acidobacteriota bacterium]
MTSRAMEEGPNLARRNRVLRLEGAGRMSLVEEVPPQPGPGEVLLRVEAVGLCGSDLHWWTEGGIGDARLDRPLVLGHEFSATAVTGRFRGRLVAVDPAIHCGRCALCSRGHPNLCEAIRFAGHGDTDGALREWMVWPEEFLHPLPEGMSPAAGMMLEPLGVALHAVNLASLQIGDVVAVLGCGPIGLAILQLVRLAGAGWVAATDRLEHRVAAAERYGADLAVQARGGEEVGAILQSSFRGAPNVVFEVAGDNAAVEAAVALASPGARILLVGIPGDDRTSFSASTARRKGLTIKLVRRMKHVYTTAIELVQSGRVDVEGLVSHRFSLDRYADAFAVATRREGLKVMIEPHGSG